MTGCVLRTATRNENDIEGNVVFDFFINIFFHCCGLAQEAREIQASLPGLPEVERG